MKAFFSGREKKQMIRLKMYIEGRKGGSMTFSYSLFSQLFLVTNKEHQIQTSNSKFFIDLGWFPLVNTTSLHDDSESLLLMETPSCFLVREWLSLMMRDLFKNCLIHADTCAFLLKRVKIGKKGGGVRLYCTQDESNLDGRECSKWVRSNGIKKELTMQA